MSRRRDGRDIRPRAPGACRPRAALAATSGLLVALLVADARADSGSPYSQTVYNEGPGIRLGAAPLVLHPGLAVDAGYDSNIYYAPSNPTGAGLLRVRAHLDLSTLPPPPPEDASTADPKLDFRLSAQVEYRAYLQDDGGYLAQRSPDVTAAATLGVLPRGPFTLRLDDIYLRTIDPQNFETPPNLVRDYDRAALWAAYRARRFEIGVGDAFTVNRWETARLLFGDNLANEAQVQAKVEVGSRTFLSVTARSGWVHYDNDEAVDALPFKALGAVSTTFSRWVGAAIAVGYGNSENRHGPSYSGVIGSAEVRFFLPRAARLRVGYDRDFHDSIFADYLQDDHAFVGFDLPFGARIAAHAVGGVRLRHYGSLIDHALLGATGYSSSTRADLIYEAHAEVSLRAAAWLAFTASYDLVADATDFAIVYGAADVSVAYVKHAAFLRADFAY